MEAANHEVPAVPIFGRYALYLTPWKVICRSVSGYVVRSWSHNRYIPSRTGKNVDVCGDSIADYRFIEDWIGSNNYKMPFAHLVPDLKFVFGRKPLCFSEGDTK